MHEALARLDLMADCTQPHLRHLGRLTLELKLPRLPFELDSELRF